MKHAHRALFTWSALLVSGAASAAQPQTEPEPQPVAPEPAPVAPEPEPAAPPPAAPQPEAPPPESPPAQVEPAKPEFTGPKRRLRFVSHAGTVRIASSTDFAHPGDVVELTVEAISGRKPVFVDVHGPGGVWLDTVTPPLTVPQTWKWTVPPAMAGATAGRDAPLAQFEAYQSILRPEDSSAIARVQIAGAGTSSGTSLASLPLRSKEPGTLARPRRRVLGTTPQPQPHVLGLQLGFDLGQDRGGGAVGLAPVRDLDGLGQASRLGVLLLELAAREECQVGIDLLDQRVGQLTAASEGPGDVDAEDDLAAVGVQGEAVERVGVVDRHRGPR